MDTKWHSLPLNQAFKEAKSREAGLSSLEASDRINRFGLNVLPQEKPYSKIRLFFSQFNTPLMYILLCIILISFLLKHYTDSAFIIFVVLINTMVGFYQENKANSSLLALKKIVKVKARVLRNGLEKEIDSEQLVLGDIIVLKAGDKVPADGIIIESKNLKINEASITGEFLPVKKLQKDGIKEEAIVPDRINMVFMGTIVEEGYGKILIVATGLKTEIGKIVSLLKKTKERKTPFQKRIIHLSRITGLFVLFMISLIMVIGSITEDSFSDVFIASVALAVSAIPEGLVPAMTVVLVLGMRRIFKHKGLVRKLAATETLGSVTVICTDKTGTLTEGNMKVSHILTSAGELFGKAGRKFKKGKNNGLGSHILAIKIAFLTNEAFVENPDAELQEWVVRGESTEKALLLAGMQAGLDKIDLEKKYPLIERISFDSKKKYAASFRSFNSRKNILYAVGAPEEIISRSTMLDFNGKKRKISKKDIENLTKKVELLAKEGLRVVACAYNYHNKGLKHKNNDILVKKLVFAGLIALKDPLRKEAKESIAITKRAGIKTIIITGDHKFTAKTIAREIGIEAEDENILEGKDLEAFNDEQLREKIKNIFIYARVSPSHKLRIVDALRANGEVVAMIGDGINDAPALKTADIGVAVNSGTDVAKEVSDLVLLDDNFSTIVKAIEQGRIIFENIRKVFTYLVADDFAEVFIFLASMILGFPLPLLPVQILWINIIEDGFPDIALTAEQESRGIMNENPRDPKEPILNRPLKIWMAFIFIIMGLGAFFSFLAFWKITGDIDMTRTIIFALVCVDSLTFAFCVRSFKKTIFRRDIFSNKYLVGAVFISFMLLIAALYAPFLQNILSTQPLGALYWIIILAIAAIETLLVDFSKKMIFLKIK